LIICRERRRKSQEIEMNSPGKFS